MEGWTQGTLKVVVNAEKQYSIWPADRENAPGWKDAGKVGTKDQCLAWIEENWTDLRPASSRAGQRRALTEPFAVTVHICSASPAPEVLRALTATLEPEELERRDRFRQNADAVRFVVGRATLRRAVGCALGIAPRDVVFERGPHGKPYVAGGAPHVSVAHSGDVVLVALATGAAIGVDVERVAEAPTREPLDGLFSAAEAAALRALPEDLRVAAFFHTWTSREAIVKAIGTGFELPRDAFDVAVDPRARPALLCARPPMLAGTFTLARVPVPPDHVAMLAVTAAADAFRVDLQLEP